MRHWTFGQRIGAGFAVLAVLATAIGVLAIFALRNVVASKDRVIDVSAQLLVGAQQVQVLAEKKGSESSHSRLHEAVEQYLFEERRDVLRLVTSRARPDEDAEQKISAVQERLINEYGYDAHSAKEALNYVTTLLSQE
jgi:uncharacterized membrane protein YhiD involved in acid resistance